MSQDKIKIEGAKEHNLKDVDIEIPKNEVVVFTGVSGSGKSSLAFDTLFAEGQRRYVESLSSYARQFLAKLDKPDVDEIVGLSPAISIDQKSPSKNPRSTVATITDIYDYMRVLFARAGEPYCPECGSAITSMTVQEIVDIALDFAEKKEGKSLEILSPIVREEEGEFYQMLYDLLDAGFREARVDGDFQSLRDRVELDEDEEHTIEVLSDRVPYGVDLEDKDNRRRVSEAIERSLKRSDGLVIIKVGEEEKTLSSRHTCPRDDFTFKEIEPRLFSFNSPYGACDECDGLGTAEKKSDEICEKCQGKRLKKEALNVLLEGKNIAEVSAMSIKESHEFFDSLDTNEDEKFQEVVSAPLREIKNRLKFLLDVGLNYLTLDRKAGTLSGGESQRIRLASQIGSGLTGTLYVLDEPTIGLHQKDNARLIETLHDLKDLGNTVLVVEHDENTIKSGDYLVDIGPGPGRHGGEIVADGKMPEILEDEDQESLTLDYLRGDKEISIPDQKRKVRDQHDSLKIRGASQHNLKDIDVDIPLRRLNVITGVSGSGKSTLLYDVVHKHLANELNGASHKTGSFDSILGLEYLHRVVSIDQSPIGRTPRSNPATYTGAWDYIRDLFASTEEARVRGYKKGRFSFNVKGGRCENCRGYGTIKIEMHFMPAVYVECDVCEGKRYDRETLEVEYKGKNIYDVLQMTVEEASEFFDDIPWLDDRFDLLEEVGLGYLRLGQPSPTLSGGEAQRVKLSSELAKKDRKKSIYLLDEPTTGLHLHDVKRLIKVIQKLVDRGNTVVVIEHHPDVIKSADWVIDLGPDGGKDGGEVVAEGTPRQVARKETYTGDYLRDIFQ